ncbi:MAG: DnaJ domain-containing protein, partial [Treponema sp.]|nr:DnaJ domain-containing protein [Treponema sp.]
PPGAGSEDIRRAYRRLALRYHPDASGDPETARRFSRIVRAYKVLRARESPPDRPRSALSEKYRRVLESGDDIFALGRILVSEPDSGARAAAAARLGLSGRSAAYVFLRRAFYDSMDEVRLAAVRSSALLGSRQAAGEVAALYARSESAFRRAMLEIAAATGERLFKDTLAVAVKDADPALRAAALRLAAASDY